MSGRICRILRSIGNFNVYYDGIVTGSIYLSWAAPDSQAARVAARHRPPLVRHAQNIQFNDFLSFLSFSVFKASGRRQIPLFLFFAFAGALPPVQSSLPPHERGGATSLGAWYVGKRQMDRPRPHCRCMSSHAGMETGSANAGGWSPTPHRWRYRFTQFSSPVSPRSA